ncbi:MAG TPA: hypothetical protein VGI12_11185 [Vicinamibacterales bacterium]|jgi:hypothetical protein
MTGPFIALGTVAVVVALAALGMRALLRAANSHRARQLAEPGAMLGLMPIDALPPDLPPFELLNTGTSRDAAPILGGSIAGVEVIVFDYMFNDPRVIGFTGVHYHNHVATATIACAKGSQLGLPPFAIEPDKSAAAREAEATVAQQAGDAMGRAAHALMSLAEGMASIQPGWRFSDRPDVRYLVRNGDQAAVRDAFTTPVLDFFRGHQGWIVEGDGDWVLVTFSSQLRLPGFDPSQQRLDTGQLKPDQLGALVRAAVDTIAAFRASRT